MSAARDIPLALQIAAVRAQAELSASYAGAKGVRRIPSISRPATAERDALQAALATLERLEALQRVHANLSAVTGLMPADLA